MILQLNINKTNSKLVSTNKNICYIYGIGNTNYTIHKDADDIREIYSSNLFKNYTILDKHDYHVFRACIRSIFTKIEWRNKITYKGKKYLVNDAYIGILGESRANIEDGTCRYNSLIFEGVDINTISSKIKYILDLSEIK